MSPRLLSLLALSLVLLNGCANQIAQVTPDFRGIETPQKGLARIYLLRPQFSMISASESPVIHIDGSPLVRLPVGGYTSIQVKPGLHHVAVRPAANESKVWEADLDLSADADEMYFLAIWNQVEQRGGTSFIPVMGPVPFVVPVQTSSKRNSGLRLEFVSRQDALPVLEESRFVLPSGEP